MAGKLEQNKEVAYLSYQLATIKTDVELELTCEQLEVRQPAAEELLGLFKQYEFKRWVTDVEAGKWLQVKGTKPAAKPQETIVVDETPEEPATVLSYDNYVTILDEATLEEWIAKLKKHLSLPSILKLTAWTIFPRIWLACLLPLNRVWRHMFLLPTITGCPRSNSSRSRAGAAEAAAGR